jgi:hypothetical protein
MLFLAAAAALSASIAPGEAPSRIRFADTFRRTGGRWQAVHIQVTRMP